MSIANKEWDHWVMKYPNVPKFQTILKDLFYVCGYSALVSSAKNKTKLDPIQKLHYTYFITNLVLLLIFLRTKI